MPPLRVPPIRPDYAYQWRRENDVAELTAALAGRMRLTAELIAKESIDVELLFLALLRIYRDWFHESHRQDLELQALLSVAAACPWLYTAQEDKLNDLLEMIEEVHRFPESYGVEDLTKQFTRDGVCRAVERALGATVQVCTVDPDLLEVAFTRGNYGDGPFDGVVCMDEYEGLYLLNNTNKDRQDYHGHGLPRTDAELEECLLSDAWHSAFATRRPGPSEYPEFPVMHPRPPTYETTHTTPDYPVSRYKGRSARPRPPHDTTRAGYGTAE